MHCNNNIPLKRLISNKNDINYPDYLKEEIFLLSIDKDFSRLIGSASYRIAKYPSDYDIFEQVNGCCSEEEVINFFINGIKKIVRDVVNKKNHWFLELKCGTDERFNLNIGTYLNGYFTINKIFVDTMNFYYLQGLVSREEITEINNINKMNRPGKLEFEIASKILRNHYILRWEAKEVEKEIKIIGDYSIKLYDAVKSVSPINIEIIAIVNNRVTDLSNFFILTYQDSKGKIYAINIPLKTYDEFYTFFLENLKKSIEKVSMSILEFNPLKLVKRYWSYGKFTKDNNLIQELLPIINSDGAFLGQLKSELKTINKLIEHTNNYPKKIIIDQLSSLKWKISTNMLVNNQLSNNISLKIDNINNLLMKNIKEKVLEELNYIIDTLTPIIDNNIINYLKSNLLYPPPEYMLPINRTY